MNGNGVVLTAGTRLGVYEIKTLLGRGGMGEVYRAHDTKLGRDVAIKVLPAGFATDPDRLTRFEREARTLASLNHPNIAHIYGAEHVGATRAIVMELVEGEDLSHRIEQGPLALAEAVSIARQITQALQTAHDLGIIHRDLKPANVKVRKDGTVKLLDFGIAKVADLQPADSSLPELSTVMTSMPGMLVGTVAYMSPEQVKGQRVDARSDVWAFGCLLFEMLAGRRVFAASTSSEILASVLTQEPDWAHLPPETPEAVRRLLRRCLEKDQTNRLHAVADARLELDDLRQSGLDARHSRMPYASRTERIAWASAVVLLGFAVVGLAVWLPRPAGGSAEVRFDITAPEVTDPALLSSFALSADGREILFVADSEGQPHVWVRAFDSVAARPLAGTGGAGSPFWAPDGRSIAFYADGFLKRLDFEGGLVRTLAKATVGVGGTWNQDGRILFVRNPASAIHRVSADGGPAEEVTRLGPGHVGHTFPHFLPDGQHFLYYVAGAPDSRGIYLGQLDGSPSRRLLEADGGGVYSNGHMLFIRQGNVIAHPFDAHQLQLKGSPFQTATGVFGRASGQNLTLSGSATGFAFRAGEARFVRQFTWTDRSGSQSSPVGDRLANPDGISASPDTRQLVFFERGATSSDLWIFDIRRGLVSQFTEDPDEDIFPLWARDGNHIIYTAVRKGEMSLYERNIGTDRKKLLLTSQSEEVFASDVSPDRRHLVYQRMNVTTGWDIWMLALGGDGKSMPVVQTDADERNARLSPDGRWLAFVSNNSGVSEIYVQPFPGPGRRSLVSAKGGDQPQWRSDGAELFYIALDGRLTATPIKPAPDHQSIEVGSPVPLFTANIGGAVRPVLSGNYVATPDGQRFLVNRLFREAGSTPLRIVLNWRAGQ